MLSKPIENTIITDFTLDFSDNALSDAEVKAFREVMSRSSEIRISAEGGKSISGLLGKLPAKKAAPGFSQRMSARFALELQRETDEANRTRIEKSSAEIS